MTTERRKGQSRAKERTDPQSDRREAGAADGGRKETHAAGPRNGQRGAQHRENAGTKAAVTPRELALDILMEILERGALSHVVLYQALSKYQYLDRQDRAFITRAVEGTLEYQIQIDYIIDRYSRTKVQKMKPLIRTLLRMSVYQILYMDRIPDSAVCNEAVKLAAKRRFEGLKGFVNGILRSIVREKDTLNAGSASQALCTHGNMSSASQAFYSHGDAEGRRSLSHSGTIGGPPGDWGGGADPWPDDSIRYSMPPWLITLWTEAYGEDAARGMLAAFLKESPFSVRCNTDRAPEGEILESLRLQGVSVTKNAYAEDMLYLKDFDYPERLTAFQTGLITAQDLSSACVAKAAGLKAGDTVLDVCGAPGGKALHAASLLLRAWQDDRSGSGSAGEELRPADIVSGAAAGLPKDSPRMGHIFVRDISERKAEMICGNVRRCGYEDLVTVQVWDALVLDEDMTEKADVVFADLPCSGLGVIGRKPDIKRRVRPEDIEVLAELQRDILSVVWQYVKPGGILVYSTCTASPKENTGNREWFLTNYPFEPVDITGRLGNRISAATMAEGYIQLLPGQYPCDGFFLAVMRRR